MKRRSLTDRQKAALMALRQGEQEEFNDGFLSPTRVAIICGERRGGSGWASTLRALEALGLVRSSYLRTNGRTALFGLTDKGREALRV